MAAKMAAKNLNLIYLSSAFRYKEEWSVDLYAIEDVEFKYEKINNNNCIDSKMTANMAAKNLILMYLSSDFRYNKKWRTYSCEMKDVQFKYEDINNNSCIISKMAPKMAAVNRILAYLSSAYRYKDN